INWGDGSPTSTGRFSPNALGGFDISASHGYGEEGNYTISVTVMDAGGSSASTSASAGVADAALTATGSPVSTIEGAFFSGVVATLSDADPNALASDYTATIDWGDGSAVGSGTVAANASGGFDISGSHSYAEEGGHAVTITIADAGGSRVTSVSQVRVADASLTITSASVTKPAPNA